MRSTKGHLQRLSRERPGVRVKIGVLELVSVLILLTVAPSAFGQDRVVILGFSGPNGGAARAAARRVLSEGYEIIDLDEWQVEASRLNARGNAPRNLARVAASLGVKAIVSGGVRRARRMWRVSIVVRDGATGQIAGRQGRSIPAPPRAASVAGALARNLMPVIDEAHGGGPGNGGVANVAPGPEPPDSYPDPDVGNPPSTDAGQYDDVENEQPPVLNDGEVSQYEDIEDPTVEEHRQRRSREDEPDDEPPERDGGGTRTETPFGWLDLSLELNGAYRNFVVPINPSCDTSARTEAEFQSALYPEIGARLLFYPGGIFTDRWPAHIGLEVDFHHHLYLRVLNRQRNQEVVSKQWAVSGGLTYRIVTGNAERGVTIWPRVGIGRYDFYLGDVGNDIIPPFTYDHIYLGLNMYIPLTTRYAGLELGGHYLAVFNIGQMAIEAYNASGQLPSTHGFQVNLGLSGQVIAGLRWRIAAELYGFISQHHGKGRGWGVAVNEGDPSTICATEECVTFPGCVDDSPDRAPVTGGIFTTGLARDLILRLVFSVTYRFGWSPSDSTRQRRESRDDEGEGENEGDRESWYDEGSREEEEEAVIEDDSWDDGEW